MEDKIQIFIPDGSYDNDTTAFEEFRDILAQRIKTIEDDEIKTTPLVEANIGAGADWPAFMAELIPLAPYAGGLALFFLGKPINENLDAWLSIGEKVVKALQLVGGHMTRGAALLATLFKTKEQLAGEAQSVTVLQYETLDRRFIEDIETIEVKRIDVIASDVTEHYRGDQVHYFRIKVDDTELESMIYGPNLHIKSVKK